MRYYDMGPKITIENIVTFENTLGFALPEDYKQFLLQINGGSPNYDTIVIPNFLESPTDIQVFFGLNQPLECNCLGWNLKCFSERIDKGILPIACDSGGNIFCISLLNYEFGTIYYYDLQSVYSDYEKIPNRYTVASNFSNLIEILYEF